MFIGTVISIALVFGFNYFQGEKYPKPQFEKEIAGNISDLATYQSVIKIELDNGNKYMLVDSRNYAYDEYLLQRILKKGDHLVKRSNSDTLIITRNSESFLFVLGDDLNTSLKEAN